MAKTVICIRWDAWNSTAPAHKMFTIAHATDGFSDCWGWAATTLTAHASILAKLFVGASVEDFECLNSV